MKTGRIVGVLLTLLVVALAATIVALVVFPDKVSTLLEPVTPGMAQLVNPEPPGAFHESKAGPEATADVAVVSERDSDERSQTSEWQLAATPLVATCNGLPLHSPVAPADITGVLFHQASYGYALVMETLLPEADIETVSPDTPARVNREQSEGEWLDAEAMHIWRTSDVTAMDTSVDMGAAAGTVLYAPVDGTVVLVRDYLLYDELPDVEIHIQPDGHPELDVVLIHNEGSLVTAGMHVQAGVTEIAHVRDIASALTDIQLGFYTAGDDPGNHSHLQVNDVNYPEYREKRLEGAIGA